MCAFEARVQALSFRRCEKTSPCRLKIDFMGEFAALEADSLIWRASFGAAGRVGRGSA
jgi:hypothetical protein